jgi:hypothetical protein
MPLSPYHLEAAELPDPRSGVPFSHDQKRNYSKTFRVVLTSSDYDSIVACACPGLPLPYSIYYFIDALGVYAFDPSALLIRMSAQIENDEPNVWIVTCEYSTDLGEMAVPSFPGYPNSVGGSQSNGGASNDPELEPPEIAWDNEIVQMTPPYDLRGSPFTNSANQPFMPAPTFPYAYPILSFTRNEKNFNLKKAAEYAFAVNDREFMGYPALTVMCQPISGRVMYKGKIAYTRVNYKFKFQALSVNPDTELEELFSWEPRILDQGMMRLQKDPALPDFGKAIPIFRNTPITQPVLLDLTGQPLDLPGGVGTNNPLSRKALYNRFTMNRPKDFGKLLIQGVS